MGFEKKTICERGAETAFALRYRLFVPFVALVFGIGILRDPRLQRDRVQPHLTLPHTILTRSDVRCRSHGQIALDMSNPIRALKCVRGVLERGEGCRRD